MEKIKIKKLQERLSEVVEQILDSSALYDLYKDTLENNQQLDDVSKKVIKREELKYQAHVEILKTAKKILEKKIKEGLENETL